MPGLDGIYVGNELKKKEKDIIIFIITSYSELYFKTKKELKQTVFKKLICLSLL